MAFRDDIFLFATNSYYFGRIQIIFEIYFAKGRAGQPVDMFSDPEKNGVLLSLKGAFSSSKMVSKKDPRLGMTVFCQIPLT